MERERERESFALLSSITTASPYRPNLIHLCQPTGISPVISFLPDFDQEQFRFRTKKGIEFVFPPIFGSRRFIEEEGGAGTEKGKRYKFAKRSRVRERGRGDGRRQTRSTRVEVERAKSELKERERVAAAGGSANRFKRISVSHGPVTIVKTESTAIRF